MDANRRYRKRKQLFSVCGYPSSDRVVPLGVSTRSKTISLLHCNGSGCGKPFNSESQYFQPVPPEDPTERYSDEDEKTLIKDLVLKSKKNRVASSDDNDNETSRGLVKDLRLRRVFSLKYSSGFPEKLAEDEKTKAECSGFALDMDSPLIAENGGCNYKEDVATGELHKRFCSASQNDNEVSSTLSSILEEYRPGEENGVGLYDDEKEIGETAVYNNLGSLASCETENLGCQVGNGALEDPAKNKVEGEGQGGMPEEFVQATPPDAESFGRLEDLENDTVGLESAQLTTKNVAHNNCIEGNDTSSDVEKRKKQITTKTMFMPRLQRKLFKVPGSFSYRRLLPFLMNVAEDYSGCMKFHVNQKDEKDVHKKPIQPSLVSEYQNISADESQKSTSRPEDFVVSRPLPEDPSSNSTKLPAHDRPELTTCQGLPESSMCLGLSLDTKNVVHKGDLVLSVDEHTKNAEMGCKESSFNKLSDELVTSTPGNQPDKSVPEVIHSDEFNRVKDDSFRQEDRVSSISAVNEFLEENETSQKYCDAKQVIHCGNAISLTCFSSKLPNLNHGTPSLSMGKENKMDGVVNKISPDPNPSKYVDGCTEELAPVSTPIHAGIQNGSRMEDTFHRDDMVKGSIDLSPRQAMYKNTTFHATRKCSDTKAKLALNPCSRPKLFKIPGSFSYKRLLPYLKEIANDRTSASGDKQLMKGNHVLPISTSEDKVFPGVKSETTALALQDELCMDEGNKTSSENVSNASSLNEPQNIDQSQDQHVLLEGDGQSECLLEPTISSQELSAMQLHDPVQNGSFSGENVVSSSCRISLNHELIHGGFQSNSIKSYVGNTNAQDHSSATAFDTRGITISASGKGILKRNPRGCRGLCMCLNCTSFRLHAEKAFEFSKNQMLDAEEVALDLIKQLTSLRKILERSANADDQSIIHLDQVKDACQKAIEAEELAKLRINQMSKDLKIHCRITCLYEPRVRFSSRVEEIAHLEGRCSGE